MRLYAVRPYPKTRLSIEQAPDRRPSDLVSGTALREYGSASAFGMMTG